MPCDGGRRVVILLFVIRSLLCGCVTQADGPYNKGGPCSGDNIPVVYNNSVFSPTGNISCVWADSHAPPPTPCARVLFSPCA